MNKPNQEQFRIFGGLALTGAALALSLACGNTTFSSRGASGNQTAKPSSNSKDGTLADDDDSDSGSSGRDDGDSDDGDSDDGDLPLDMDGSDDQNDPGDEAESGLDTDDDKVTLVPLPLDFQRFPDTAANDNCLFMIVNDEPEQKFGCNHSGGAQNTITVNVKPKPHCNTIRLRLTSKGIQSWTTANAADIPTYFRLSKPSPNVVKLQANDNRDDDFNDLNLTISGRGEVNFTIENTGQACD